MGERYGTYKQTVEALVRYREAYFAAARADPEAVKGLPHPDDDPRTYDPAEALARLQGGGPAKLVTDPARDLRG